MYFNLYKQWFLCILLLLNINLLYAQTDSSFLEQSIAYFNQEEYANALYCLRNNTSSLESLNNQEKIDYYLCMGFSYIGLDNFKEAEPSILNALDILNHSEQRDSSYIDMLSLVGWFYFNNGEFARAKQFYEEAIKYTDTTSTYHDEVISWDNLAICYYILGDNEKARSLYEMAWFKYQLFWKNSQPYYQGAFLNHAALFYKSIGDNERYYRYVNEKIDLYGSVRENIRVSSIPGNLYISRYDICMDIDWTNRVQSIQKQKKENPLELLSLSDELSVYFYNKLHPFTKCLSDFDERFYDKMDVSHIGTWGNSIKYKFYKYSKYFDVFSKAESSYTSGEIDKAEQYILDANPFYADLMKKNLYFLDNSAREIFWYTLEPKYDLFYSTAIKKESPLLSELCYDNCLQLKSILLNSNIEIRRAILSLGDSILTNHYNEYIELSQNLQKLMTMDASMSLVILENKKKELETYLSTSSLRYISNKEDEFTWVDIKNKLKDNEYAIEFVCFNRYQTNNNHYVAFIIGKNYESPILVDLFEETQLEKILNKNDNTSKSAINNLYGSGELYNLLWKPLESYLVENGEIKVYFSVSGKLNQIAFHAIPISKRILLGEKYNLHQLSSTRQIINDRLCEYKEYESIAIWGNMDYDSDLSLKRNIRNENALTSNTLLKKPRLKKWEKLNDENEVNSICILCNEKKIFATLYSSTHATENSFRAIDGKSPDIIDISTHGFHYPLDSTEINKYQQLLPGFSSEISLLCSGLIFSGVNNNSPDKDESNDGVLFAQEIANMNLLGTDLVVLSACQTGLGEIRNNEGVFGLQRAFKLAGVNTLLISLWDVPVEHTGRFISQFYKELLSDKHPSKQKAFRAAQLYMQQSDDLSIYDWAGFILID
jgi:CHAT domain-containing protein